MFSIIFMMMMILSPTVMSSSIELQERHYHGTRDVCKDLDKNCHYWFRRRPNFCAIYGPSICKKYCGYCDTCKDWRGKTYFCRIYKRRGKCRSAFANRYCRRTCKKCT